MYGVPTARSVCVGVMLLALSVIRIMQFGFMGMKEMERSIPLAQRDSIHFGDRALVPLRWIAIELLRRQARGFKIGG